MAAPEAFGLDLFQRSLSDKPGEVLDLFRVLGYLGKLQDPQASQQALMVQNEDSRTQCFDVYIQVGSRVFQGPGPLNQRHPCFTTGRTLPES